MGLIQYYKTLNFGDLGTEVNLIEHLKDAIDLLEKGDSQGGSQVVLASAYAIKGNMHFFLGEYDKSLTLHAKSQKILENKDYR